MDPNQWFLEGAAEIPGAALELNVEFYLQELRFAAVSMESLVSALSKD